MITHLDSKPRQKNPEQKWFTKQEFSWAQSREASEKSKVSWPKLKRSRSFLLTIPGLKSCQSPTRKVTQDPMMTCHRVLIWNETYLHVFIIQERKQAYISVLQCPMDHHWLRNLNRNGASRVLTCTSDHGSINDSLGKHLLSKTWDPVPKSLLSFLPFPTSAALSTSRIQSPEEKLRAPAW